MPPTVALPPELTPEQALRRLRARGVPGLALLESLGPLTPTSARTLLSAAPTRTLHTLPPVTLTAGGDAPLFPAWIGGLRYEAAAGWDLPVRADGEAQQQYWGFFPSGVVWDRAAGTVQLQGEPHLDWAALLAPLPTPLLEAGLPALALTVGPFAPPGGAPGTDQAADYNADYAAGVRAVQGLIRAGEVYQVNLSRELRASAEGDPLAAYLALRRHNPSPFMAYLELEGLELEAGGGQEVIVSCSPERLVCWTGGPRGSQGGEVSARPIAGTRRRGASPGADRALEAELRASPKERAEHVMLTDLLRHDLGGAARPGSVTVPELMVVERYSHVMHLVSEVRGAARPDLTPGQLLRATFPGGTITGAPKRRVMQAIAELEREPRGWYTGSAGFIGAGRLDLNILIRTAVFGRAAGERPGTWTVRVRAGAGVVMGSDPAAETRETQAKAQALLDVLGAAGPGAAGAARAEPAPPSPGVFWQPPPARQRTPLTVLLLDNLDSFTRNIEHDLWALGARVIVRGQHEPLDALLALGPQAVLVGPGPGTPQTSGVTLALTRAALARRLPLLGLCLGHQALGEVLGGRTVRARRALHGHAVRVRHAGDGLFAGVPPLAPFARYHSLTVQLDDTAQPGDTAQPDEGFRGLVTATSAEPEDGAGPETTDGAGGTGGEVMALSVAGAPAWGVQFHPESVLSPHGRTLLGNWLRLSAEALGVGPGRLDGGGDS